MTLQELTAKLSSKPKGSFFSITTRRPLNLKKGFIAHIEKQSQMQGLVGVEYGNTANVRAGILSGERDKPHLPNGAKRFFYEGNLKLYEMFSGSVCLGVNLSGNAPKSRYFRDGQEVSEEKISNIVLSNEIAAKKTKTELAEKNQSPFVLVKLENVVDVC